MKSTEFKRWLANQGVAFKPGKGSHLRLELNGRISVLPMHNKELGTGLVESIKEAARTQIGGPMRYPIKIRPDGRFFLVTFPDFPEAITQGETIEQAIEVAQDALETALEFYFEDLRPVPEPSPIKRGQHFVELPASLTAKILLLNEMIHQKVRPAELARRLGTTPQAVNRLTNLRHASKIDGIATAMKSLGKTLEIRAA